MKDSEVMLGLSMSLGTLVLAGAGVAAYLYLKGRTSHPSAALPASPGGKSVVVGNGVVAPVGLGSSIGLSSQLAALRAQEEAWRKADALQTLENRWADLMNRIKLTAARLDSVDNQPMPDDIKMAVIKQAQDDCWAAKPWYRPSAMWSCGNTLPTDPNDKYFQAAKQKFDALKASQRTPYLAEASQQASEMQSLIVNFAQLGVTKSPVNVRTV